MWKLTVPRDYPEAAKGQAIEKKPKPGRKALAKSALIVQPMNNQQNTQLSPIHQERCSRCSYSTIRSSTPSIASASEFSESLI
jgi:hypothetical protein